jgi:cytosolic carboxypeptidase protein 2/3
MDTVYISHAYPYTFSKLCKFLDDISADEYRKRFVRRRELCLTIAGNKCEYLTITNQEETMTTIRNRRAVVITARVHPGENMASFAMEGVIHTLCGPSLHSKLLRDNFIFYIVPMLNIDGVVVGNHRCNLSGVDLNRQWHDPSKKNHPTIFHTKAMIKKIKEERELFVFCDIHGHNKKKNIFLYGCPVIDGSRKELIFPLIMSKNCDVFSYKDCSWAIPKDRENCARVIVWKEFGMVNSFTLEISYLGPSMGKYECYHFNLSLFHHMADALLKSIYDAADSGSDSFRDAILEIEALAQKKLLQPAVGVGDERQGSQAEKLAIQNQDDSY